jgi:hypothetical protein
VAVIGWKRREKTQTAECSTVQWVEIPAGTDPNKILKKAIKKIFYAA